jgi:tetratricopeptide repeat protein/glycosyl transferase family 9 (putative heptosyltransferase)
MLQSAAALHKAGRLAEAQTACRDVLNRHPDHPAAVHLLGIVVGRLGRTAESVQLLRQAVQLQPLSAQAHHNLAFALRINGSVDDAIAEFNRAIQIRPDFAEAHNNLGIAWKDKLKLREATACYSRAIQIKPDFADAHWNLALVLLMGGDFAHGLAEYEWRRKIKSMWTAPAFSQPQWSGEDLGGRTILLFPEQGLGDAIQFARYVPLVARRGGRVILTCQPELARLFQRLPGGAKIVVNGQPIPPFDVQCSLVGLPRVFATDLNSIPAATPYLTADPALVEKWSQRLGPTDGRLRAGLAWGGNPAHQNDRNRSIQPQQLFPLTELSHVALYSLQKGKAANQSPPPAMKLIDFTSELSDFADTAALIANLDLVVTVDTAVAHLAGALAKPTWVLLPFVPDWRWLLDRQDSPWYPTMRLFRQPTLDDWNAPIAEMADSLRGLAAGRSG